MRNLISSLNTKTCKALPGPHMKDFHEQITAMYLRKNDDSFKQKKQPISKIFHNL